EASHGRGPRAQPRRGRDRDRAHQGGPFRACTARAPGHLCDPLWHLPALGGVPVWGGATRMSATRVGGPVLSGEQAAAAHAGPQGAFLIAAGPGTGKTFTATERFCWLFEQELMARLRSGAAAPFDPDSFSALTVEDLDDLLRSGLRFLLKLKGRGINPDRFRHRALDLHAQHWSGRPAPNGSGGPDPARA